MSNLQRAVRYFLRLSESIDLFSDEQGRHGKKAKKGDDDDDDDDMSSSGDDEEEVDDNGGEEPPKMHYRTVMNVGGINRVRSCPQQPGLVVVWCDNGQVKLLDAAKIFKELADEVEPSTR